MDSSRLGNPGVGANWGLSLPAVVFQDPFAALVVESVARRVDPELRAAVLQATDLSGLTDLLGATVVLGWLESNPEASPARASFLASVRSDPRRAAIAMLDTLALVSAPARKEALRAARRERLESRVSALRSALPGLGRLAGVFLVVGAFLAIRSLWVGIAAELYIDKPLSWIASLENVAGLDLARTAACGPAASWRWLLIAAGLTLFETAGVTSLVARLVGREDSSWLAACGPAVVWIVFVQGVALYSEFAALFALHAARHRDAFGVLPIVVGLGLCVSGVALILASPVIACRAIEKGL